MSKQQTTTTRKPKWTRPAECPATGYVIRTEQTVLARCATLGATLAAARKIGPQKETAVFMASGASMGLASWLLWANSTIARLESRGLPTAALLANDGTR